MEENNVMETIGTIVGALIIIALVILAIALGIVVLLVVAAGGFIWGGGTALFNYGSSFAENVVESNWGKL